MRAALDSLDKLARELCRGCDAETTINLCHSRGFPVLGYGSKRIVVSLSSGLVAKIPHTEAGLVDNSLEFRIWNESPSHIRALLAPTLAHTRAGVNVQRRCIPVSCDLLNTSSSIEKALQAHGIYSMNNLGIMDYHVVCFNYAHLPSPHVRYLLTKNLTAINENAA